MSEHMPSSDGSFEKRLSVAEEDLRNIVHNLEAVLGNLSATQADCEPLTTALFARLHAVEKRLTHLS